MMPMNAERRVPLLVVDLDGTIRHGKDELGHFVNAPEDVVIFPEALELLRRWKQAGGRIVAVSNQGGIALGHMTMQACAETMLRTWQLTDQLIDKIAWCSHHPAAADPEWARCWCRKPAPGLLIEAALELAAKHGEIYPPYMGLFVGDRDEDAECARLAGFDFCLADQWRRTA